MTPSAPHQPETPPPSTPPRPGPASRGRLAEVARLFTRLGFTAFGGPAVHTALMEDEVVARRRWLDREHFLDLVGALNFIPGPNSTELAIHLGLIRAGLPGLVVAGVCFITPAVLIILPIAWAYVHYAGGGAGGDGAAAAVTPPPAVAGALAGVAAVVVAVLAVVTRRFAAAAFKSRLTVAIALLTFAADFLLRRPDLWLAWYPPLRDLVATVQSEIVILLGAAVAGAEAAGRPRPPAAPSPAAADAPSAAGAGPAASERRSLPFLLPLPLGAAKLAALAAGPVAEMGRLAWYFLTVGATLFGSGYVLVSYLETGLVHKLHWLTQRQLADAIAVGQVTPGPLLTTATFVGYLRGYQVTGGSDWGGVAGGLVATAAIFGPSFVLVAAFGRVLPALRRRPWARGALDGMNAAVVALLVLVTLRFAAALSVDGRPDVLRAALALAALALMMRWNVNPTWLIAAGAAIGGLAGYH